MVAQYLADVRLSLHSHVDTNAAASSSSTNSNKLRLHYRQRCMSTCVCVLPHCDGKTYLCQHSMATQGSCQLAPGQGKRCGIMNVLKHPTLPVSAHSPAMPMGSHIVRTPIPHLQVDGIALPWHLDHMPKLSFTNTPRGGHDAMPFMRNHMASSALSKLKWYHTLKSKLLPLGPGLCKIMCCQR